MSHSLEQVKIAKRYVKALFSAVTKESDIKNIAKDMADLRAMVMASVDLQSFIKSPLLSKSDQISGVDALATKAKFSSIVTNFLKVLCDNRRLNCLPVVIEQIEAHLTAQAGTIPVAVATARPLSAADQKKIQAQIKESLGRDIIMQAYVDETLIGGMVLQVESTLIDGSIKTKLDKLERQLVKKSAA